MPTRLARVLDLPVCIGMSTGTVQPSGHMIYVDLYSVDVTDLDLAHMGVEDVQCFF